MNLFQILSVIVAGASATVIHSMDGLYAAAGLGRVVEGNVVVLRSNLDVGSSAFDGTQIRVSRGDTTLCWKALGAVRFYPIIMAECDPSDPLQAFILFNDRYIVPLANTNLAVDSLSGHQRYLYLDDDLNENVEWTLQ